MFSKKTKWVLFILSIFFLVSCSKREYIQDNFYRDSRSGKIYYKSKGELNSTVYNQVDYNIDFNSMFISGAFILDKDSVYYFYGTSSGTLIFKLEDADRKSFQVLEGGYYAVDKKYVFRARGEIVKNADIHSFEPIIDSNIDPGLPLGRDKNNIYLHGDVITDISDIDGLSEYIMKNPL